LTDAPQSAGLVALADRIELWPIDRLRPYAIDPVSGDLFIALNGSDRTTWNPVRRGHPADQV
jgi:hypothetical protein